MEKQWFVFYTKSRHEKRVNDLLTKKGFAPFLPLQTVLRQWSDRRKKIPVPLFNSYIFVCAYEHEIPTILTVPGIAWVVRYDGQPAVLRDEEITVIQRFLDTGLFVESTLSQNNIPIGSRVEVVDGPLKGLQGSLESETGNAKFCVLLESIHQTLKVQLPTYLFKRA